MSCPHRVPTSPALTQRLAALAETLRRDHPRLDDVGATDRVVWFRLHGRRWVAYTITVSPIMPIVWLGFWVDGRQRFPQYEEV